MRRRAALLATVSSFVLVGATMSVRAADIPVKAPPLVEPAFSWTGFYVGIEGGGAWLRHKQDTLDNNGGCAVAFAPLLTPSHCSFSPSGGTFGAFAGYNWQAGNIVFGVEADGGWTGLRETRFSTFSPLPGDVLVRGEVEWLASARARLGVAMSPTLLYVTGGAAFGGINSGWSNVPLPGGQLVALSDKHTKTGWVGGGGIEHAFSKAWSVRLEGLHYDLGRDHGSVTFSGVTYATQFRHTVTVARAGLALRW